MSRSEPVKQSPWDTVTAYRMTPEERADLIAFLQSLTDTGFLSDPRYANPWPRKDKGK